MATDPLLDSKRRLLQFIAIGCHEDGTRVDEASLVESAAMLQSLLVDRRIDPIAALSPQEFVIRLQELHAQGLLLDLDLVLRGDAGQGQ